jgi:hypothetical protein
MTITNVILDPDDCGWCATLTTLDNRPGVANRQTLRRFVAYIQRKNAPERQMILCERTATGLSAPLGTLPGPAEGIIQLDADIDAIIVTYTGRVPGDDTGPFRLQEARIPVAGVWPAALAALVRVRQVAYVLANSVPASRPAIDPYIV